MNESIYLWVTGSTNQTIFKLIPFLYAVKLTNNIAIEALSWKHIINIGGSNRLRHGIATSFTWMFVCMYVCKYQQRFPLRSWANYYWNPGVWWCTYRNKHYHDLSLSDGENETENIFIYIFLICKSILSWHLLFLRLIQKCRFKNLMKIT